MLSYAIVEDGQYHWVCWNSSWVLWSLRFGYKEQDFINSDTVDFVIADTLRGKFSVRNGESPADSQHMKYR